MQLPVPRIRSSRRRSERALRRLVAALDPPRRGRRGAAAAATVLLFGAAFGAELSGVLGTADAAGVLYVLPIALAAVSGGLRGGLVAGVAAVVLLHVAAALGGEPLGPAGHAARDLVLLATAVTIGSLVERMHVRAELVDALHRGLAELGHGVVAMDEHTRTLLYASDAAAAIYRRTPEELRGMAADDLAGPDDRERVHERRRLRNAGHRVPARAEISVLGPAGEDIRIESALVPVSVEGERIWAAVVRDVSARRDAERRVAADRGFLQTVLDTAATPIAVLDADGRIVTANRAVERMAGLGEAMLAGRTPWELGLIDRDDVAGAGEALRAGGGPVRHVVAWRAGDDPRTVAWTTTAVRGADGKLRHAVTIGLDVTEQRAAEERARRAHGALEVDRRALLRARRDLAEFAAAASHDLRGPLSDIAAAIAEIDHDSAADFEGHARRAAAVHARAALARANGVLDAMGDFGRLGAGDAIARDVDVERTVDGVLLDLAADIAARGADVTRGPLPTLPGDPAELRTLIERLVGRALRTAGGAAPRVHVDATRRGQAWELCVADVGAGRVAGAERAPGLDLALCRRIAERHGGGLSVDADTAVRVTLPDRGAR